MPRVHGIKTVFVYARIVLFVPVIQSGHKRELSQQGLNN
jgi:hypothetical protein